MAVVILWLVMKLYYTFLNVEKNHTTGDDLIKHRNQYFLNTNREKNDKVFEALLISEIIVSKK